MVNNSYSCWPGLKNFIFSIISTISAIISPSLGTLYIFVFLWIFDLILGWSVSEFIQNEGFKMVKVGRAFLALLIIGGIIAFISVICYYQGIGISTTRYFSRIVGWAAIYFYCINILKNFRRILPSNQFLLIIEWFLRFDLIRQVKYLRCFQRAKCKLDQNKLCDYCGKCIDKVQK